MSGLPRRAEELLRSVDSAEHGAQGNSVELGDLLNRIAADEAIDECSPVDSWYSAEGLPNPRTTLPLFECPVHRVGFRDLQGIRFLDRLD